MIRERKKLNSRTDFFSLPGTAASEYLCLQCTPRIAQTTIMVAPLAWKHDSNEDELRTHQIHAVLAENIKQKVSRSSVPIWAPKLAKARSAVRPAAIDSPCCRIHSHAYP